jgi:hypothetical protein
MKYYLYVLIMLLGINHYSYAQVGIGTTNPDVSSILDIESSDKGVLIPRLTTAEISGITNPADGLLVYNTDTNEFQFNYGTSGTPNWLRASRNISIKYNNNVADTAINVNSNSVMNAPIISTLEWNDDSTLYSVNLATNTITVNSTGRYRISVNVSLSTTSNTDRLTPEMWIKINGTQRGTYSSTGYIRTNQGHQESSLHINEVFQLNANDVVSVGIIRTANSGTVNLRSASSSNIYIERI